MNKVFVKFINLIFVIILLVFTGCAGMDHNHDVLKRLNGEYRCNEVQIIEDPLSVKVNQKEVFVNNLYKKLITSGFEKRNKSALVIKYRIILLDKGNRLLRTFAPAGKGTLIVEITYIDYHGNVLAVTMTKVELKFGIMGGNFNNALIKAADIVSKYTIENFKI